MSRDAFEKLFPVPTGFYWNEITECYMAHHKHPIASARHYQRLWQGFQAGHAAGLERAAVCE